MSFLTRLAGYAHGGRVRTMLRFVDTLAFMNKESKSSRFLWSRKGTYDEDGFAFDIVVPEQPEVVPDSSREREVIRLGPRVDRKQGYTKHPSDTADVQY